MLKPSYKTQAIGIGLVSLSLAIIVAIFGLLAVKKIAHMEELWNDYNRQATASYSALHEIRDHIGYGGFIHNFKNYILRRDSGLLPVIAKNLQAAQRAIDRFERLDLNQDERAALTRLRSVVDSYAAMADVARDAVAKGIPSTEIDRMVKVNDVPALEAIADLASSAVSRSDLKEIETGAALTATIRFFLLGALIIPAIFGVGFIILVFFRRIVEANRTARLAQEEFENLLQTTPLALITISRDGSILRANNQVEKLLGYDQGALLGQKVEILLPKRLRTPHLSLRDGYFNAPVFRPMGGALNLKALAKDGREIPVEIQLSHTIHRGEPVATASIADISERLQAEQELRASQTLLQTVFDTMPTPLVIKDTEERYLRVNKEWCDLFGVAPEDAIGRTAEQVLHWPVEQQRANVQDDSSVLKEGLSTSISEQRRNDKNGKVRVFQSRKGALRDDNGNLLGLIGIGLDITDLKQTERELQESKSRLQLIADALPATVMYMDVEQRYQFTNKSYEKWMKLSPGQVHGKRITEVVPPATYEVIRPHLERALAGNVVDFEGVVPFPDGITRHIHATYIPDFAPDGAVRGFSALVADITERKMLEEQFRESQKMEAVGQLAGGIAHEFNNAMQVIRNCAFFIQNNPRKSESVAEFVNMIIKSADRTAGLTQQLLGFSRKSLIQKKILHLNELVSNQIKMMGRLVGEQIEIEHKSGDHLDLVKADPGVIEQIIINLCVNARDAMPNGGHIRIETQNLTADQDYCNALGLGRPGRYVMLSVSDNGTGISPENQQHIFEPFFTTKGVGQGTGLGLAMVYGAVQQHDGVIQVFSEPGAGSTFKIYLPGVEADKPKQSESLAPDSPYGNETILVAEDEDDLRTMLSKLLESQGYRVFTARDGKEALSVFKAKADEIDLLILDMVMPKLRGRETYERIRSDGSNVPVLFSSGYSPDDDESVFLNENGLQLIQKPYAPEVLFTAVREALDTR